MNNETSKKHFENRAIHLATIKLAFNAAVALWTYFVKSADCLLIFWRLGG